MARHPIVVEPQLVRIRRAHRQPAWNHLWLSLRAEQPSRIDEQLSKGSAQERRVLGSWR
jgi:hypothetical protein